MESEHIYFEKYPEIFSSIGKKTAPKPRSKNTMTDLFKKFRAFLNWCYTQEYITHKPFSKFKLETETYGTPFYLTLDELKKIHTTHFKDDPILNIQKDIFVFQCCIGCRVGDLMKLKKTDIINGNIEYIPHKTIKATGKTVIVPLNNMARRTFIGNIYKKVKDPNLVASLTGHTEGSKAFSRYRDIDTEMKRELVGMLE